MSKAPKIGGAAFPLPQYPSHDGMSLRDWFAGQALAGVLPIQDNIKRPDQIAADCYIIADAMIKERAA
jgi:hypothetical protein